MWCLLHWICSLLTVGLSLGLRNSYTAAREPIHYQIAAVVVVSSNSSGSASISALVGEGGFLCEKLRNPARPHRCCAPLWSGKLPDTREMWWAWARGESQDDEKARSLLVMGHDVRSRSSSHFSIKKGQSGWKNGIKLNRDLYQISNQAHSI